MDTGTKIIIYASNKSSTPNNGKHHKTSIMTTVHNCTSSLSQNNNK